MSKVLSIYNDAAFCEIILPALSNTEYSFLLDAELFHLRRNVLITLECVQGTWFFSEQSDGITVKPVTANLSMDAGIGAYGRYGLTTPCGEKLTVLAETKDNPLSVYRKYMLIPQKEVSVGYDQDNAIRYRYPAEKDVKSFVSRHHCVIRYDGTRTVLEDSSSNGTYVNNVSVHGSRVLVYGDSIRVFGLHMIFLGTMLAVNAPAGMDTDLPFMDASQFELLAEPCGPHGSSGKSIVFRAPRIVPKVNTEPISIDPPPAPRELANIPLFMQIGPAMTMALPMLLGSGLTIAASRAGGAASPILMMTGLVTAVASAAIGVFWAIINMRFNKKMVREGEARRFDKYGHYLIEKQNAIEAVYRQNSEALREKYLPSEAIAQFEAGNEKLWNRNFNHSDILTYRIGTGDIPSPAPIDVPKSRFSMVDDALAEKPELIKNRFSTMHQVPVCIDLKDKSLVGVIGETNGWAQIIKNLIVQIAGSNSYTDVKIAFAYDATKVSNARGWEFVKWLPHTWSEDRRIRFFATNKNEANEIFYALGQTMRTRSEDEHTSVRPHYILFVLNKELLEGELISKYISDASDRIGLSTIIASEQYENLPNNCEFIIEKNDRFSGVYSTIDETTERIAVDFDPIGDEALLAFAKRLANTEVEENESGGEIPASLSFFEMYAITRPEELEAQNRWRKAKTAETMKALVGFKSGSAPCYLDIHERYHGPHGLVAGTTGSGKSETLQTYVLSLAINYSPDDVGFFIIDYKGGGMANLFEGLPHMIGAISNLSGNQVRRAMVSIKSENKRRQRIFSDYGVNNINAYTSLYKSGNAKEPMPHLFIIIDEFAELKREEPEFMRELVSVAQVGRSLGVHLILATQKPAGTVDDNIWSNSKFRLCLRVQDRQDSMDMLHRTDAAYLTQAGRCYLQVGNDELFELFQSGYSGAAYDASLSGKRLVVAQMLDPIGKVDLVGNHFKIQHQENMTRQWITVLCRTVREAVGDRPFDDSLLFDETFLSGLYARIVQAGSDLKRGPYNDSHLREFVRLVVSQGDLPEKEAVQALFDAAGRGSLKLPELKSKTQLEAVCQYLAEVARANGYTHSIRLWMPVLPERILLSQIEGYQELELQSPETGRQWTLSAVIGKGDDPENQDQMPISIDFANNGHHAVCGTVATGKSTFLQTAVYSFVNKYSSDELNFYIIDFSAKLLNVFSGSQHVGGVMTDAEEDAEKIAKFFTMLASILEERKKILSASNFRDYVEHSGKRMPAIVLVIDNYAAFREKTGERYEDQIRQVAKDGLGCGIFLLVTAGGFGTSEISSRLADSFRTTICLELSDIYQYSDVLRVVKPPLYPESNVKGRGLVYLGEKIIEFQTALACDGESIFDRNDHIRTHIEKINALNPGKAARRIPVIPEKPMWEEYIRQEDYAALLADPVLVPNGYDAETAAYSSIDLTALHTYVISGTRKSGKSTYMKNLISAFADKGSDIYIMELESNEFERIAADRGCRYIRDGQGIYDFAKDTLTAEIEVRAEKKKVCLAAHMDDDEFCRAMLDFQRLCVFIPNLPAFVAELYDRESPAFNAVGLFELMAGGKGQHYNILFFTELDDGDAGDLLGYRIVQNFKGNGNGIRFGGKYLSQRLFDYKNIPFKMQDSPLRPGVGTVPSDDESARQEQIVVPNNRA